MAALNGGAESRDSRDGRRRLDRREVTAEGEHVMWIEREREREEDGARFFT